MLTSQSNARIKTLVQLRDKSKVRNELGLFLVEGVKMFLEAPIERIREVYVSESFYLKCTMKEEIQKHSYEIVADDVFKKISDTVTPQGIITVVKQYDYKIDNLLKQENPCLLLLEDIQDPGNLGTMIRTGEGAGIHGVILSSSSVDVYNPKTIRSTMGSIYRVPFFYTQDLQTTIQTLQKRNISVYAAHLLGTSYYDEMDYTKGSAFLIGNEGNGLKEETAKMADCYVKIPMKGQLESLNAAIAGTLFMYEAEGQRRKNTRGE